MKEELVKPIKPKYVDWAITEEDKDFIIALLQIKLSKASLNRHAKQLLEDLNTLDFG